MKIKKNKSRIIILAALVLALLLTGWVIWGNCTVGITRYSVFSEKIPEAFSGYKILQISDLHNAEFGGENETLLELVRQESPDIIAITGDFVDSNHTDLAVAIRFAGELVKIAPCYYVTGNHEAWLGIPYNTLENAMEDAGVILLRNQEALLEKEGQTIQLLGVDDPAFGGEMAEVFSDGDMVRPYLEKMVREEVFTILLSHRPELFDTYVETGMDLVLSGHAHGGQFRVPFLGGLAAPDQGLFPKYDAGIYEEGTTRMVVSRGIGNSIIPVRVNNRPELVVVELSGEKHS